MSQSLFLLMGSHLFPPKHLPKPDEMPLLMIEDYSLCRHFRYHKHKLLLFLESMRNHADLLKEKGYEVIYEKLDKSQSFEKRLQKHAKGKEVNSFEIEDRFFKEQLNNAFKELDCIWKTRKSPLHLHSDEEFEKELGGKKRLFMKTFYEAERKRLDILMEDGGPVGGKYSFDAENRKKLPKNISIFPLPKPEGGKHRDEVVKLIDSHFDTHPGSCKNFWLPTTRKEALDWLRIFIEERFEKFGAYEDAISSEEPFIFHSVLSPLLNCGLLTPKEVLDKVLDADKIPINSKEGFVRQIIGWREFIRGVDACYGEKQEKGNFFNHKRKLKSCWWTGNTGLKILDTTIKRVVDYGYCHHIERLMVLSNLMLLCEVDPKQVYKWFMELFVDSADWVMGPNVYGMGQFSDGGLFATKPYLCGSNYLLKMSDYKKGEWCEIVDGLYWRFIDKHRSFFNKQPRLKMMAANLDKMDDQKKKKLFDLAKKFQEKVTDD